MRNTKYFRRLCFLGLVLVSAFVANAQKALPSRKKAYKPPIASDLVDYTSADRSFEIVFPAKPDHKEAATDFAKTSVTLTNNNSAFSMVSVYNYKPDFPLEKNQYLENYRSRILSSEKAKIDSETDAQTGGVRGSEFKIDNYNEYEVRRVFIVGNRVFELKSRSELAYYEQKNQG